MRVGAISSDADGTLICDRCRLALPITPNTTPDGWRFLMTNVATVAADLCPDCVDAVLTQLREPVSVSEPRSRVMPGNGQHMPPA